MLFILSGHIQGGKTRWLQESISQLEDAGVKAYGVLAPGRWTTHVDEQGAYSYEKLGIDNVLLPSGVSLDFATRRDLLAENTRGDACTQAEAMQLGWSISDASLAQVNAHFDQLATMASRPGRGILVVDELGRLELERRGGIDRALALVAEGPSLAWQHAIAVVRDYLVERASGRLGDTWGGHVVLKPDDASRKALLGAFGIS